MHSLEEQRTTQKKKALINEAAKHLDSYSETIDRVVPELDKEFHAAMGLTAQAVIVSSEDGNETDEDLRAFLQSTNTIISYIGIAKASLDSLLVTIRGTPRLTTEMNRAKARAIKSVGALLKFLESSIEELEILKRTVGKLMAAGEETLLLEKPRGET